ncbi:MAG: hypothetical protein IT208_11370 [Chthonomonadales bacterium]|nr:hypothetical protein [Chthonomonadales bacterium]
MRTECVVVVVAAVACIGAGSSQRLQTVRPEPERRLEAPPGQILSVAVSRGASVVLAATDAGHLRVWKPASAPPRDLIALEQRVTAVAVSPEGRTMAVGSEHGIQVWDTDRLSPVRQLRTGAGHGVTDLAYSADGRWLAVGKADGAIGLLAVAGWRWVGRAKHLGSPVWDLAFSPAGDTLACGSGGGQGLVLTVPDLALATQVRLPALYSQRTVIGATARIAAGTSPFGYTGLWELPAMKRMRLVEGEVLGTSAGGSLLVGQRPLAYEPRPRARYEAPTLLVAYAPRTGELEWQINTGAMTGAACSPDDRWVLTWGHSSSVKMWRMPGLAR